MHSFGKDYFTYYRGAFSTGLYEPTLSFDENYVTYFLVRLLLKTGNFLFTCCSFYSRDQSFSTYAKFSEKLIFLAPLMHVRPYLRAYFVSSSRKSIERCNQ